MSRFDYIYPEDGSYRNVIVEAELESPLAEKDSLQILRIILNVVESEAATEAFFGGITSLHIDEHMLALTLRFPLEPEDAIEGDPAAEEALARKRLHFVLHLFAKIDEKFTINGTPFKFDFREFVEL